MLNLIKFTLLTIASLLLFACNRNDDIAENVSTPIFKGKIQNENGEALANQNIFLIRKNGLLEDIATDTVVTDNNGSYFIELASNNFSLYDVKIDAPHFDDSTFAKSIQLYDTDDLTLGNFCCKEIMAENEWDFFFCKKNTIGFQIQKTSPEFKECEILIHSSPEVGNAVGLGFKRLTITNIDTSFILPFCQLTNISFSWEVKNEEGEIIENESASLETLQNTPMEFTIDY